MKDKILLIFLVAALTFFLSMYLRLGGILSGLHLISFTTLNSSSSSLQLSISAFLTNISSSVSEPMRYVSCCCSLSCHCSTKTSGAPCSSNWCYVFSLSLIISWSSSWTSTVLLFLFHYLLISLISMFVNHLFVLISLVWSANRCSITGKTPISSHIFFIRCLYFLGLGSLLIQHSITILFTAFSHLFSLFSIRCLMMTCWAQIRYPMHAELDTNAVIFNSLIWHFTLFEAMFYVFYQPMFLSGQCFYLDIIFIETPRAE